MKTKKTEEISRELCHQIIAAHPLQDGEKEYMIDRSNAVGLCCFSKCRIYDLYDELKRYREEGSIDLEIYIVSNADKPHQNHYVGRLYIGKENIFVPHDKD